MAAKKIIAGTQKVDQGQSSKHRGPQNKVWFRCKICNSVNQQYKKANMNFTCSQECRNRARVLWNEARKHDMNPKWPYVGEIIANKESIKKGAFKELAKSQRAMIKKQYPDSYPTLEPNLDHLGILCDKVELEFSPQVVAQIIRIQEKCVQHCEEIEKTKAKVKIAEEKAAAAAAAAVKPAEREDSDIAFDISEVVNRLAEMYDVKV